MSLFPHESPKILLYFLFTSACTRNESMELAVPLTTVTALFVENDKENLLNNEQDCLSETKKKFKI